MSAVDDLAVIQGGRSDAAEAADLLTTLFDLPQVGNEVRSARVSGQGSSARVAIDLATGGPMQFDSIKDMSSPTLLAAELVACTGALPKITRKEALRAIAFVRRLAHWTETQTAADIAFDWGASFLQTADRLDANLSDQAQRWAAFERLKCTDPYAIGRFDASAALILVDADGTRWVRANWFHSHVREQDKHYSQQQVAARMAEAGWSRRGRSGRIKATCPNRNDRLGWSFFLAPPEWETRS